MTLRIHNGMCITYFRHASFDELLWSFYQFWQKRELKFWCIFHVMINQRNSLPLKTQILNANSLPLNSPQLSVTVVLRKGVSKHTFLSHHISDQSVSRTWRIRRVLVGFFKTTAYHPTSNGLLWGMHMTLWIHIKTTEAHPNDPMRANHLSWTST